MSIQSAIGIVADRRCAVNPSAVNLARSPKIAYPPKVLYDPSLPLALGRVYSRTGLTFMTKIISVHSFRGGTGRTTLAANFAALLAADGRRVGVVDLSLYAPGMAGHFGLNLTSTTPTLLAYLQGQCTLEEAAHNATPRGVSGHLILFPSTVDYRVTEQVWIAGEGLLKLSQELPAIAARLGLEYLFFDLPSSVADQTLTVIALSDVVAIVLRHDRRDYEASGLMIEMARRLGIPKIYLIVNEVPALFDRDQVVDRIAQAYDCRVVLALPYVEELATMMGSGLFALQYPDHPATAALREAARQLLA